MQLGAIGYSKSRGTINRKYAELIYEEYHRQYPGQTFERLHERGGFGVEEGFMLLGERIKFLEARCKGKSTAESKLAVRDWRLS